MKSISSTLSPEHKLADLFDALRQPARFQILLVIRDKPACVCHLEAVLGLRQASISQHLMLLRKAGWVVPRRESRNIFYGLAEPRLVQLLESAALIQKVDLAALKSLSVRPVAHCPCPQCNPDLPPELSCKSLK